MTHHASSHPSRVESHPREKGAAHTAVRHGRRHRSMEGKYGVVGSGTTITGATVDTSDAAYPGISYGSLGLFAFNAAGGITFQVLAADGSLTVTGTGVITGGTIQTSAGAPRVVLDTAGLRAFNAGGVQTFAVSASDGSVTVTGTGVITGGTIQTSATNPRVILDGSGLRAFNSGGTQTFNLSGADGSLTVSGTGSITGATVQTSATNPRVVMDTAGLRAFNSGGTQTFNLASADGSLTVTGTGTITGAVVQSSVSNPRVVMDTTGIRAFNSGGTQTFKLSATDGSLVVSGTGTITGGTIQTSATNPRVVLDTTGIHAFNASSVQTVNIGNDGSFSLNTATASITAASTGVTISSAASVASGARVVISPTGIIGYNASNVQEFLLDATSGLISATGVIFANPGSTLPWQTTGFFVGGGNLLSNASAEDPTSSTQLLYVDTGTTVTAGTFTLKYGSGTTSSSLNWNATAAQVQTALNASGVLPSGVTVTCSGGPLPGTPIVIGFSGTAGATPSTITVASTALTGGTAQVGVHPLGWSQYQTDAVIVNKTTGAAWHGGNVFQGLINHGASGPWFLQQEVGPFGFAYGTPYTISGYFKAPSLALQPEFQMEWRDANHARIVVYTATAAWSTNSTTFQRLTLSSQVPPQFTRQQVSVTGGPTAGSFTLTYKGQTTAAIAFNASAATVASALGALNNVGASGAVNSSGGPLPGSPVYVSLIGGSVSSPALMTIGTNSLTGGASPAPHVSDMVPVYLNTFVGAGGAPTNAASYVYVDALQLEVADVPTAFAPKADEILANTVQANMINVAQLSAITADLGSITAGTVTGATLQTASSGARMVMDSTGLTGFNSSGATTVSLQGGTNTITGATIQTAATGARIVFSASSFITYDASNPRVAIDPASGITLAAPNTQVLGGLESITWRQDSAQLSSSEVGEIRSYYIVNGVLGTTTSNVWITAQSLNNSHSTQLALTSENTNNGSQLSVFFDGSSNPNTNLIIARYDGASSFLRIGGNLQNLAMIAGQTLVTTVSGTHQGSVTVTHGLGRTPTQIIATADTNTQGVFDVIATVANPGPNTFDLHVYSASQAGAWGYGVNWVAYG